MNYYLEAKRQAIWNNQRRKFMQNLYRRAEYALDETDEDDDRGRMRMSRL
jgi:hypothetical protein